MRREFMVARLHMDLGLFETSIRKSKKEFIRELLFELSREKILLPSKRGKTLYFFGDVQEISDDFLEGKIFRVHQKKVNTIEDLDAKELTEVIIPNAADYNRFYYHMNQMLFFLEEKSIFRSSVLRYVIKNLIEEVIKRKKLEAIVDLNFLASRKTFTERVLSLKRITSARFVLVPSNPNRKKLWEELDKDMHESKVERREIKDIARPGQSLDYKKGNTLGAECLYMVEDGYGEGEIRGEDEDGTPVKVSSKESIEKVILDPEAPKESIISILKSFIIKLRKRNN